MNAAPFTISARDGAARAGVIQTPHGPVRTPAFVPLASTGTVKSLHAAEVAGLGYDMVLGNTFHLFIQPGHELVRELGGLHEFMGWRGAIVTDSGGYQVFSMGHGSVAEEIKRRRQRNTSMVVSIAEEGVRFRSYLDGSERFMGPETSMEVQAALGSDIALAFDECTPFHVEREYTESSMERTHRWLDRCVAWHREHPPAGQLLYGIVQGGVYEDLRARSTAFVAESGVHGIAIGGSLGESKEQMREVVGWTLRDLPDSPPRHLLGIGDVDDLVHAVGAGIDTFDCATPTRLARHGTALVHDPGRRWRLDLGRGAHRASGEPIDDDCPCPACREHTRAYLHYLVKAGELTGKRLLTLHNLTFMERLMGRLRGAIERGRLRRGGPARARRGGCRVSTLSFWLDEPYQARPPVEADEEAEVCVVGGGVAGLSCALHLARRGIETVVLEGDTVAAGASGRNGGFLLAGMATFHVDARERYGREAAVRVYRLTLALQDEIYALAAELGAGDAVRRTGLLRTSASAEEADHVRRHVDALRSDGFPAELVERDELPEALRRASWNACLTDHDGALQPARWIRALARAAEQAGARIRERSPVEGPIAPGDGVRTAAGALVRSRAVVVAADGALPALVPRYRGRVRSRRLHMIASAPLAERIVERPVYSRWGYEYLQQTPDGRVLAGGFSDLDGERLVHRPRRRQPGGLAAHRALPRRRPGRDRARDPSLGRAGRVQRRRPPVRRRRARGGGPVRCRRLLGHGERAGLRRRPPARRRDRRRGGGGAAPARRPLAGVVVQELAQLLDLLLHLVGVDGRHVAAAVARGEQGDPDRGDRRQHQQQREEGRQVPAPRGPAVRVLATPRRRLGHRGTGRRRQRRRLMRGARHRARGRGRRRARASASCSATASCRVTSVVSPCSPASIAWAISRAER